MSNVVTYFNRMKFDVTNSNLHLLQITAVLELGGKVVVNKTGKLISYIPNSVDELDVFLKMNIINKESK